MSVVTIRGQLGSGAPEVGKEIAKRLQADYVDREIIAEVAARLHREEQEVIAKEMPPSSLLGRIAEALEHGYAFGDALAGAYLPLGQLPLDDLRYLQGLEAVVRDLARNPRLVIFGRGSEFILKDYPGALHILIVAPLEVRVKRIMESKKLDHAAAKAEIARFDSSIIKFLKRYFKAEFEDPVFYDLVVNTERISYEDAAAIAIDTLAVRNKTSPP